MKTSSKPKKRKRTTASCVQCGRIVSASGDCGNCKPSTSTDITTTETGVGLSPTGQATMTATPHDGLVFQVKYQVVNSIDVPLHFLNNTNQLALCDVLGIEHRKNPYRRCKEQPSLSKPVRTTKIHANGDCLFQSLSYCVSGDVSNSLLLRAILCSYILSSGSKLSSTFAQYGSPQEYISESQMENPTTYGSETEILAFTMLTKINVYIYSDLQHAWFRFAENLQTNPINCQRIYLHHKPSTPGGPCNHFEPVYAVLATPTSNPLNITSSEITSGQTVTYNCSSHVIPVVDNEARQNFQLNHYVHVGAPAVDECNKCRRQNTSSDNLLSLVTVDSQKLLHQRTLGANLKDKTGDVRLCRECANFLLDSKGYCWKYGWPSALYTLLTSETYASIENVNFVKSWFPTSFRKWWGHCIAFDDDQNCEIESVFRDITLDIEKFQKCFEEKKFVDYAQMLNDNPYCDVKCINGDTTFVSQTGGIGFHHFVHMYFPDFVHFEADHEQHLASIRSDYLESYVKLDKYKIMPCLKLDPKQGLVLATCPDHNKGSNKRMVHLPVNPALGPLAPQNSSQFSSFAACPRTIKTGKLGFNTHSYQLYKASGGFSGISTLQIRSNEIKKQTELNCTADALAAHCRQDFRCQIDRKLQENKITDDLHLHLTEGVDPFYSVPTAERIDKCLKGATCVDFNTAMKLKLLHDSSTGGGVETETIREEVVETSLETDTIQDQVTESITQTETIQEEVAEGVTQAETVLQEDAESITKIEKHKKSMLLLVQPSRNPFGARPRRLNKEILSNDVMWRFASILQCIPQLWEQLSLSAVNSVELRHLQRYLMLRLPQYFGGVNTKDNKKRRFKTVTLANTLESLKKLLSLNDRPEEEQAAEVTSLLAKLESVHVQELDGRGHVSDNIITGSSLLVFHCNKRNDPSAPVPPRILSDRVHTYELQYLSNRCGEERNAIACYGGYYQNFWQCNNKKVYASKCAASPSSSLEKFRSNWDTAVYVLKDSPNHRMEKYQYLQHMGGQGRFICAEHDVPLTKSPRASKITCSTVNANGHRCSKRASFRCPSKNCLASICTPHFNENLLSDCGWQLVNPPDEMEESDDMSSDSHTDSEDEACEGQTDLNVIDESLQDQRTEEESHIDSDCSSDDDPFNFATDAGIANTIDEYEEDGADATDAGAILSTADLKGVPSHVILNGDTHLLKRFNNPITVGANNARFLQNMVATSPGNSNPLLYVEAGLFSDIIWYQNEDGSYPGAIPASLYGSEKENGEVGVASIRDHLVTRIKDCSLPCASNAAYIQFAFDVVFNSILKHHDSRVVLKRGWQDIKHGSTVYSPETQLKFDVADSRKNVMELSAAMATESPTYFLTLTCNQSEHPGVAPIFRALQKFIEKHKGHDDVIKAAVQAEMIPMLRAWERAANLLMHFIEKSPDQPLGPIKKIWYRFEFQTTRGNFPHIHCIIWTGEDKFSDRVRDRIVCKQSRMKFEFEKLVENGIIADDQKADEIYKDACKIQSHNCDHAGGHCQKLRDGELVCKVPLYPAGHQYTYKLHKPVHSDAVWEILNLCDLATAPYNDDNWKIGAEMQGGKHQYPASKGEHLSPFNPFIFAITRSSQNLQISDTVLSARYMTKYSAGVEEHSKVKMYAGGSISSLAVEESGIQNEKITGVRAELKKKMQKDRNRKHQEGRLIGITETVWWLLQFGYVKSSFDFVHVPTVPIECRGALKINKKRSRAPDGYDATLQSLTARKKLHFPSYRMPTRAQIELMRDNQKVDTTMDKITIFGLRPPELLFVSSPIQYFRWFVREKPESMPRKVNRHEMLLKSSTEIRHYWVDLTGFVVKIRPPALQSFLHSIEEKKEAGYDRFNFTECSEDFLTLYSDESVGRNVFVSENVSLSNSIAEVVTSNILPSSPPRFLIHLVLSMGQFETELDLFNCSTLQEVFRKSEILPLQPTEQSLKIVMKKYILDQLMFLPGGVHIFDRNCEQAWQILKTFFLQDSIFYQQPPPVVLQQIVQANEDKVEEEISRRRETLIKAVYANGQFLQVPAVEDILKASRCQPLSWNFSITRSPNQTDSSFDAQKEVLQELRNAIDKYEGNSSFHHHQIVVGPPGTGKTFLLVYAIIYASCKGFYCSLTSLAAERSSVFGGLHIHANSGLSTNNNHSVGDMASFGINKLSRDPVGLAFIRKIDIMFVEEIGMISAEQYCAIDLIYQHIRCNRLPFGGVLLIGTGDARQLRPPSGSLLWMSPLMLTTFRIHPLNEFVRMDRNGEGQKLLKLMGTSELTEDVADEIVNVLSHSCNFVENWESVVERPGVIRVFGTRAAERDAVQMVLTKIEHNDSIEKFYATSKDQYTATGTTNWKEGTCLTTKLLNNRALEPRSLTLYKYAPLRLTINNIQQGYTQGQLCLVKETPSVNDSVLEVFISPFGNRHFPDNPVTFDFLTNGWRVIKLKKVEGHVFSVHGMSLRRIQYPVKHFFAATIHKTMGETLAGVITKVSSVESKYTLWEKEQIYVLVSRVKHLSHVTFVGDKEETLKTLKTILLIRTQWSTYVDHFLGQITQKADFPQVFDLNETQFVPYTIEIPRHSVGYVYMLVSRSVRDCVYVGETCNLRRRLREHNSGMGASFTNVSERRPWSVFCFLSGFESVDERKHCESFWHNELCSRYHNKRVTPTTHQVYNVGLTVLEHMRRTNMELRMVLCGRLRDSSEIG